MAVGAVGSRGAVPRAIRLLDYVFFLFYALVGLRVILELLGAREASGFKQLLLVLPFKGILPDPGIGDFQLMLAFVAGLFVYALPHTAIRGFLRLLI